MSAKPEDLLLAVATTIADSQPVDWAGMCERHPDLAEDFEFLRLIERIAQGARTHGSQA